jgi:hypothetical protein
MPNVISQSIEFALILSLFTTFAGFLLGFAYRGPFDRRQARKYYELGKSDGHFEAEEKRKVIEGVGTWIN